jgi:hypothetical protein
VNKSKPLARNAATLANLTRVAIFVLLAVYLGLWIDPELAVRTLASSVPGLDRAHLTVLALISGFVLGLIPLLVLIYALWQVRCFFHLYCGSDLFPAGAGTHLRNFGIGLLVLAPIGVIARAMASVLFTLPQPQGARQLAITVSSNEIFILLIGALVMMIGRVLGEAHRLAEENCQFL